MHIKQNSWLDRNTGKKWNTEKRLESPSREYLKQVRIWDEQAVQEKEDKSAKLTAKFLKAYERLENEAIKKLKAQHRQNLEANEWALVKEHTVQHENKKLKEKIENFTRDEVQHVKPDG